MNNLRIAYMKDSNVYHLCLGFGPYGDGPYQRDHLEDVSGRETVSGIRDLFCERIMIEGYIQPFDIAVVKQMTLCKKCRDKKMQLQQIFDGIGDG